MLIVLDDMIVDIESNTIVIPIFTELFLEGRKLNFLFVFIPKSYSKVSIRVNPTTLFYHKNSEKKRTSTNSI